MKNAVVASSEEPLDELMVLIDRRRIRKMIEKGEKEEDGLAIKDPTMC